MCGPKLMRKHTLREANVPEAKEIDRCTLKTKHVVKLQETPHVVSNRQRCCERLRHNMPRKGQSRLPDSHLEVCLVPPRVFVFQRNNKFDATLRGSFSARGPSPFLCLGASLTPIRLRLRLGQLPGLNLLVAPLQLASGIRPQKIQPHRFRLDRARACEGPFHARPWCQTLD